MHGKEKDALIQIQGFFCLREFVVSYDPRFAPQIAAKKPFLLKSHLLGRGSQLNTELILVDTSSN